MPIYHLSGVKKDGRVILGCPKCLVPGIDVYGAQNKVELAYLLICEKCFETLGEWTTREERDEELREFARKVLAT